MIRCHLIEGTTESYRVTLGRRTLGVIVHREVDGRWDVIPDGKTGRVEITIGTARAAGIGALMDWWGL